MFSLVAEPFYIPRAQDFQFLHFVQHSFSSSIVFFYSNHPEDVRWYLTVVFIYISLMIGVLNIYSCPY